MATLQGALAGFSGPQVNAAGPSVAAASPLLRRRMLSTSVQKAYDADPRSQGVDALKKMGLSSAPVQGGLAEALARVGTSYFAKKGADKLDTEYQTREAQRATDLQAALANADPQETIRMLGSNPDTQDLAADLRTKQLEKQAELAAMANQPITPYQMAQLEIDRQKLAQGQNGLSYTMPDGTVIQIGGTGAGSKLTEAQGQASSRATLINNGLQTLENTVSSPNVNSGRLATAQTLDNLGPFGQILAKKALTPEEQQYSAAKDATLEGLASAVTGAGVTQDQFTRFSNMLPSPADDDATKQLKMDNAYDFLLNQTNIAGPIAQQIRDHVVARNAAKSGNAVSNTGPVLTPPTDNSASSPTPDGALMNGTAPAGGPLLPPPAELGGVAAPPRKITTEQEFNALPSGTRFIAPDGTQRVKP